MFEVQRTIYKYQGAINKLSVDDKGLLVLAVFGLPPYTHSDDPFRAVQSALNLLENIAVSHLGCGEVYATSVPWLLIQCTCGFYFLCVLHELVAWGGHLRDHWRLDGACLLRCGRLQTQAGIHGDGRCGQSLGSPDEQSWRGSPHRGHSCG